MKSKEMTHPHTVVGKIPIHSNHSLNPMLPHGYFFESEEVGLLSWLKRKGTVL